jgi:hypothetical protein
VKVAPGWFNSPSGDDVPDDITEGPFPPVGMSKYRHFIVRAQAGRFYTPTALAFFINEAGRRIEQGNQRSCYDDDNGYAFRRDACKKTPDSTALPFRMFGAHCVALRLSLNVIPVSD